MELKWRVFDEVMFYADTSTDNDAYYLGQDGMVWCRGERCPDLKPMLHTGLDNIYDGDILDGKHPYSEFPNVRLRVGWLPNGGMWGVFLPAGSYLSALSEMMGHTYKVIGNIHENPELLKGGRLDNGT